MAGARSPQMYHFRMDRTHNKAPRLIISYPGDYHFQYRLEHRPEMVTISLEVRPDGFNYALSGAGGGSGGGPRRIHRKAMTRSRKRPPNAPP